MLFHLQFRYYLKTQKCRFIFCSKQNKCKTVFLNSFFGGPEKGRWVRIAGAATVCCSEGGAVHRQVAGGASLPHRRVVGLQGFLGIRGKMQSEARLLRKPTIVVVFLTAAPQLSGLHIPTAIRSERLQQSRAQVDPNDGAMVVRIVFIPAEDVRVVAADSDVRPLLLRHAHLSEEKRAAQNGQQIVHLLQARIPPTGRLLPIRILALDVPAADVPEARPGHLDRLALHEPIPPYGEGTVHLGGFLVGGIGQKLAD